MFYFFQVLKHALKSREGTRLARYASTPQPGTATCLGRRSHSALHSYARARIGAAYMTYKSLIGRAYACPRGSSSHFISKKRETKDNGCPVLSQGCTSCVPPPKLAGFKGLHNSLPSGKKKMCRLFSGAVAQRHSCNYECTAQAVHLNAQCL